MIAVFRIRFDTNKDPATVWSDTFVNNWLNISVPYSLANFWWESGWGHFDLSYQLFPELVMGDPRSSVVVGPGESANVKIRGALVNGVIQKAISKFAPTWEQFDIALLWFAQPTDMFGGGTVAVPLKNGSTKNIRDTVVDISSPFHGACQELGHSFGLDHELDRAGNDYGCPYSVMSAMNESNEFVRPTDPRLPEGRPYSAAGSSFFSIPANRIAGAALPAAQLRKFPWFIFGPHVVRVPVTYFTHPATVTLYALDHARARSQSELLPALAHIPPKGDSPFTHVVELRRGGGRYDKVIGDAGAPSAGLVVHSFNSDERVVYQGVLAIGATHRDFEWTSSNHTFALRLLDVGPNIDFARFLVVDGTYQSDILWHNSSTNEIQIWGMNGQKIAGRSTVVDEHGIPIFVGLPWRIVGVGDMSGDEKADIVWHSSSTNEIQIWGMNGHKIAGRNTVVDEHGKPIFVGLPWRVVGVGDMSGDGKADIVWHSSSTGETQIWFMDHYKLIRRGTVLDEHGTPIFVGLPWGITGVGDMNGNNRADIVWHNSSTNETQIWAMDRERITGRATVTDESGTPIFVGNPWNIVGGAPAEIFWHNSSTNETQIWSMDRQRIARRATVLDESGSAIFIGPPWSIAGSGNLSGRSSS